MGWKKFGNAARDVFDKAKKEVKKATEEVKKAAKEVKTAFNDRGQQNKQKVKEPNHDDNTQKKLENLEHENEILRKKIAELEHKQKLQQQEQENEALRKKLESLEKTEDTSGTGASIQEQTDDNPTPIPPAQTHISSDAPGQPPSTAQTDILVHNGDLSFHSTN